MKITGIPSRTTDATYTVEVDRPGEVTCDCPGYQFAKSCRHCDAAQVFEAALRPGKVWRPVKEKVSA